MWRLTRHNVCVRVCAGWGLGEGGCYYMLPIPQATTAARLPTSSHALAAAAAPTHKVLHSGIKAELGVCLRVHGLLQEEQLLLRGRGWPQADEPQLGSLHALPSALQACECHPVPLLLQQSGGRKHGVHVTMVRCSDEQHIGSHVAEARAQGLAVMSANAHARMLGFRSCM
jgi:hypothetical protein